jgi:hypothetical protein
VTAPVAGEGEAEGARARGRVEDMPARLEAAHHELSGLSPGVRSHCRFRTRGAESLGGSGLVELNGGAKRQCDRLLLGAARAHPSDTTTQRHRTTVRLCNCAGAGLCTRMAVVHVGLCMLLLRRCRAAMAQEAPCNHLRYVLHHSYRAGLRFRRTDLGSSRRRQGRRGSEARSL